jgi:hypothetical protein
MGLKLRYHMPYIFLTLSVLADEEFPFLWMTDNFSATGPQSSLWSWTSCMLPTPPNAWDDLNITNRPNILLFDAI